MYDTFLTNVPLYYAIPGILVLVFIMGYNGLPNWVWAIISVAVTMGYCPHVAAPITIAVIWLLFIVTPIRAALITKPIMAVLDKLGMLPAISDTEREAIDAGTVWVEKEFFSGRPDFKNIMAQSYPKLTEEEQAFVDGPVETVCKMVTDYQVQCDGDLPPEVWDYIKKEGFFSFIIKKKYGGLEFSALAVSTICGKLQSHCGALGITVMVPNSLGPAELLQHYGTDKQKDYYLPRLADGREVPCFALTEPTAGSDAGAISARGEVFKHESGELYIRLNFRKRYITLAAVSTVMGLAFKLDDPDNLLGKGEDLGITCALIPSDTPGVRLGRRHDPLGSAFFNCPINGENVEVPLEKHIIGGSENAGKGWRMLMNCLSAGRAVTLPATSTGVSKLCTRAIGAYAKVRKQFGISIGRFEGVQEPMAEIAGHNYLLEATRIYTCGGVDAGEKPSVVSALAKYHFTEIGRESINHAMDIAGGSGISKGPNNIFATSYISTPIGITVEGANILTRTMIIFGQGLIRCHPYAQDEVNAIEKGDVGAFDKALWKHIGFVVRNHFRAVGLSLTRGWMSPAPHCCSTLGKYYRRINWASAVFAVFSDIAMGTFGGDLKRKERITGRLGDMVSWMYMATCVLKRFEEEGFKKDHEPFAIWALDRCMQNIQVALEGLLQNLDIPVAKLLLAGPILTFFRLNSFGTGPDDETGTILAEAIQQPGQLRDDMTVYTFIPDSPELGLGRLEEAFALDIKADDAVRKLKKAMRSRTIPKASPPKILDEAVEKNVITAEEAETVRVAYEKCVAAIQVDEFALDDYVSSRHPKAVNLGES